MSHDNNNNNNNNKEEEESPRPRQLQYNYPPPPSANHNNFYPPPPHHHPSSSYHHGSYYHPHGGAYPYYNTSQTTTDGTPSYGNPHGHYGNHHYYYGGGGSGGMPHNHHQVPPTNNDNNNTVKSPYFSPSPPPLPPVPAETATAQPPSSAASLKVEAKTIYQKSPYFSEAPPLGDGGSSESTASTTISTDVHVPLPPKSAFMCFSEAKGNEIAQGSKKSGFVEAVASEWKSISKQEKAYWESMAKNEKTRFAKEKEALCLANKGPIIKKVRAKKNPLAPKRNMSAFLMFAQQRRRPLQKENPDMSNADISRLLGEVWRNASVVEKRPFLEREEVERKIYKAKMEAWKNDQKLQKSLKKSASVDHQTGHGDQQRQDTTPSTREDSYSRFDSGQRTMYPMRNQVEAGGPYYEYVYNPVQAQQHDELAYAVKYSYPRPPGDY